MKIFMLSTLILGTFLVAEPAASERSLTNPYVGGDGSESQQLMDDAASKLLEASCLLVEAVRLAQSTAVGDPKNSDDTLGKAKLLTIEAIRLLESVDGMLTYDDKFYVAEVMPKEEIEKAWRIFQSLIDESARDKTSTFSDIIHFFIVYSKTQSSRLQEIESLYPTDLDNSTNLTLRIRRQSSVLQISRNYVTILEATSILNYSQSLDK